MSRRDVPDDDLVDLLADLETTLEDLRREFGPTRRRRPPTPAEIIRFTEEYSLPTIIAILEVTVRSLELLRQVLRLVDPERSTREEPRFVRDRLGADLGPTVEDAGELAFNRLERGLSDLRTALDEADLPEDPDARSILEDARALTAEIDGRIREVGWQSSRARERDFGERDRGWRATDRDVSGAETGRRVPESISIPVVDETDEGDDRVGDHGNGPDGDGAIDDDGDDDHDDHDDHDDPHSDAVSVDVEAELETIRREVHGDDTSTSGDDPAENTADRTDDGVADGPDETDEGPDRRD